LLRPLPDGAGGVAGGHVVAGAVEGGFVLFAVGELKDGGSGAAFAEAAFDGEAASCEKANADTGEGAYGVFDDSFGNVPFGAGGIKFDEVQLEMEGIVPGTQGGLVKRSGTCGEGAGKFGPQGTGDFPGLLRPQSPVFRSSQFFEIGRRAWVRTGAMQSRRRWEAILRVVWSVVQAA